VHPILTADQAELTHQALIAFLNTPSDQLGTTSDEEEEHVRKELSQLVYFFDAVVAHPEQFQPHSKEDTKRIVRTHRASLKGPAQPKGQRNKRKQRQEARMATAKRRRKNRKAYAEAWNKAVERYDAEQKEAEEVQTAERDKVIGRFEELAKKDTIRSEELQEILELFGSPEGAERVREIRREASDTWGRIERAAELRDERLS
jgi:hypothetical protein